MTTTSITSATDLMDTPASSQAMNGPFEKPEAPQTSSALMQLPAELRLKIYGYLLNNGSVLEPQQELYTKTNEKFRLSTQALRTCQLFYREGSQVLCDKNVLGVRIDTIRFPDMISFSILDKPVTFKCGYSSYMHEIKKLETLISTELEIEAKTDFQIEMPRAENATERYDRWFHKTTMKNLSWMNRHLDSLHRFKNLDVEIKCLNEQHLFGVIYMIADFLNGKNVTLRVHGRPPPAPLPAILTSLRCEKFTLAYPDVDEFNAYVPVPGSFSHHQQLTLPVAWPELGKETFDTILGDTPVEDLLPEYKEFRSAMVKIPFNNFFVFQFWLLECAVMRQDRADFYVQARALLASTRRAEMKICNEHITYLQDQIERARNFEVDDEEDDEEVHKEITEEDIERKIQDLQTEIDQWTVIQTNVLAGLDDLETSLPV